MGGTDGALGARAQLPSKIRAPRQRSGVLERTRLLERLDRVEEPLVVLNAPAGYGKTTLARQWMAADDRAGSWVTVDRGDDDPVELLRDLVMSLDSASPLPRGAVDAVDKAAPGQEHLVVSVVEAALAGGPGRLIVLDDIHLLRSPVAIALLDRFAGVLPDGSTLVVCGRSVSSIHLARRELEGTLAVLDRDALAFSADEARAALDLAVPDLDHGLADRLVERAEGWPAGLQLAAMAVVEARDPDRFVDGLPQEDVRTTEYVREEVLDALDVEDRDFLIRSSVLDAMCGPLCDEVLDSSGSGRRLDRLASSANLFVVGLDDSIWYRCHHLFRDLLLSQLRSEAPEAEAGLRAAAATWLADRGHADAAVHQAVASGDRDLAARLVLRHLTDCIESGTIATLERWLAHFDDEERRSRADLSLCTAWWCMLTGRIPELRLWLDRLEERTGRLDAGGPSVPPLADGSASFHLALDGIVMVTGCAGAKSTLEASSRIRQAGPSASPWWATAGYLGALSSHILGQQPDPRADLRAAELDSRGRPTTHAAVLAQLALAELWAGDRSAAFDAADRAADEAHELGIDDSPLVAPVLAATAVTSALRGRSEAWRSAAETCLEQMRLLDGIFGRAQLHLRLVLVDAALAGNDVDMARTILEELPPYLEAEPEAVVLHDRYDALVEVVGSHPGPRLAGGAELTVSERKVLVELATHRSLEEIGERLYVSRNTVKSHTIAIYRKLGVSGRSAAVDHAKAVGLLAP